MLTEWQRPIEHRIMHDTTWMGVPALKNPMDAWTYQEIIWRTRPDWIVEIGNHAGGGLLFLAHMCELVGHGRVLGVDVSRKKFTRWLELHPRISVVTGDALAVYPQVEALVWGRVMVVEDSAHTAAHTLAVLRMYGRLVWRGGYMVCEDGVMDTVAEALEKFTGETDRFVADPDPWPVTWNPGGYLRCVR